MADDRAKTDKEETVWCPKCGSVMAGTYEYPSNGANPYQINICTVCFYKERI